MKKVTFVIESLGYGGAERVLTELAKYLSENGYEITIITFKKAKQEYQLNNRIKRVDLEIAESGINKLIIGRRKLKKELKRAEVSICISFDILANILLLLSAPKNCKVIISERNAPKQTELSIYSKVLRFLLYRKTDLIVFQTEEAAKCYSKKIQGKSVIIANPIKENLPVKQYDNVNKEIVAVGRLAKQKNYELMLFAFKDFLKKHKEYILSIYGDGDEREKLQNLCKELSISENVIFHGKTSDVHSRICNAEVYLLTSHYEGIPNALLEAMAMGFPVVATNCPSGGVKLLLSRKSVGILVDKFCVEDISCALCSLVENPINASRMGKAAQYVRDEYSIQNIGHKWIMLIEGNRKK